MPNPREIFRRADQRKPAAAPAAAAPDAKPAAKPAPKPAPKSVAKAAGGHALYTQLMQNHDRARKRYV